MTPDALDLLSIIQKFLNSSVADQVPAAMRSDIRAAAKSLANARDELDASFPLLARECDELVVLVKIACGALCQTPRSVVDHAAAQSLTELRGYHADLSQEVGDHILALQGEDGVSARAALAGIFAKLREQAGRRLGWQSVFPPNRLISDVLRGTWPRENG